MLALHGVTFWRTVLSCCYCIENTVYRWQFAK